MSSFLTRAGVALSLLFMSGSALAQAPQPEGGALAQPEQSAISVNEAGEIIFDETLELPALPELEESTFAVRTLTFEQGMEELRTNSLSLEIARKSLEDAAIVEQQVRQIFSPTVNAQAFITYNSREIALASGNMYAPLSPYLDSQYNNDPALQQFFADNPDVPDARMLAQAEVPPTTIQYHWTWGGQLTATQPLFTARVFPGYRLAQLVRKQANAGIEMTLQASAQGYNELYHNAFATRQYIAIAKKAVENATLSSDRARILYEEQAGSEFDLIRADVTRRAAERDYENAKASYQMLIEALATLIRVEPNFDVVVPQDVEAPASLEQVVSTALSERAELRMSEIEVQRYEAQMQEARLRLTPTILAQGNVTATRATALSGDILNWSVSLIANWDLYDGGAGSRDRRSARINAERSRLERVQKEEQIRDEIRRSWINLQNQETIVEQSRVEVALASKAFEVTFASRELGAASQLDVDNAMLTLYQAQLALATAEAQRRAAIYNLYIVQGTSAMVLGDY